MKRLNNLPLRYKICRLGEPSLEEYAASRMILDTPQAIYLFWQNAVSSRPDHEPEKEILIAVSLNAKLRPLGWHLVSTGSVNETTAHPREIFRAAIITSAYALVIAHNHPSGDPAPSQADRSLTQRLREGAGILQLNFIDHVVVGTPSPDHSSYFSFRDAGLL